MDSFTQIALGATIGEAGWRKSLGGRAPIWGALCGLLPDLDAVAGLIDPWNDLVFHRSWTHSLIVIPLAAIPIGWLGHRFGKRRGTWWQWVHLSFWALITHPLLDLFTFFGTQLFAPFSDQRFAVDGVSIIDLFYTLPLVAVCVTAFFFRGEPPRWRRRLAWGVLAATTAYLLLGLVSGRVVRDAALAELRQDGFEPDEIRALPTFLNNQAFRIVARRGDTFRIAHRSNLAQGGGPWLEVTRLDDPFARQALATEHGQIMTWFSDGMLLVREDEQGEGLELIDLRFGGISVPIIRLFPARALRREGRVEVVRAVRETPAFGSEPGALWDVIWTGRSELWPVR